MSDTVSVVNIIPHLSSGETSQDSEPNLAVNPANPQEIAAAGQGMVLVEPGDVPGLADRIEALLSAPSERAELGRQARLTVARGFTWERCGEETMSAYGHVLPGAGSDHESSRAPPA